MDWRKILLNPHDLTIAEGLTWAALCLVAIVLGAWTAKLMRRLLP